jgi:TPR repeat protein
MTFDRIMRPSSAFLMRKAACWALAFSLAVFSGLGASRADLLADGVAAYAAGDYGEAAAVWEPLATRGDPLAQFNMGLLYETGQGVGRAPDIAAQWYERAAKQGVAAAQYNLAVLYQSGRGVGRDLERSLYWLEVAARDGTGNERSSAMKAASELRQLLSDEVIAAVRAEARDFLPRAEIDTAEDAAGANLALTAEQVATLQRRLSALGYDAGPADGMPGEQTRQAIRRYLDERGISWRPTDALTQRLLDLVEQP